MPIKKTVTEVIEGPEDEQEIVTDEDLAEEMQASALDGLVSEFAGGDDTVVNIYRQGEGKNLAFLFKTTPEEMTGGEIMERCRDRHPPEDDKRRGDYRMHVRQGRRLVANRPFSVEAPKDDGLKEQRQDTFGTSELMALMTKQNENMQTLMLGTMQALANAFANKGASQPVVDPVAMQQSTIQGIAAMKQIADGDKKEPGAVEMLVKGIELAKDLAPKSGETNTSDILLKGMEMFPLLAQAGGQKEHINPPVGMPGQEPVHALKGPPQQPGNPTPEQTPATEDDIKRKEQEAFLMQAKNNLVFLCAQAQQNKDPELYADLILDQMGEEKVKEFIGKPDALEQLAQIEPGVMVYKGWFIALRTAILEMTSHENQEHDAAVPNESVIFEAESGPDPSTVVARINESGLRRDGRTNVPVNLRDTSDIPSPESSTERGDGDATGDS